MKETTSTIRELNSTPLAVRSDIDVKDDHSFKILCTSDKKKGVYRGSYDIRCLEFKKWIATCAKNVRIDTGKPLSKISSLPQYDATLVIKAANINVRPEFGNVFIDIVDNYKIKEEDIPEGAQVIVQNEFQGLDVFPNRQYHVVQHMFNSYPDDFQREYPEYIPNINPVEKTLHMATIWNVNQRNCPRLSPSVKDVNYLCICEHWGIQNWYSKYMFRNIIDNDKDLDAHVNHVLSSPHLSSAKLYNEVFWNFDVLVVPAKFFDKARLRYGSLQRTTSQMRSGVPVLVEAQGDAMRKLIEDNNYTCAFVRSPEGEASDGRRYWSLDEATEKMKSVELRKKCQQEGLEIAKKYSPVKIGKKMLGVLGYDGPFEC